MKNIRSFFSTFFKSLTSPEYYREVVVKPFSFSFKYFFLFNLFTALVTTILFLIPIATLNLQQTVNALAQTFPSDLQVKMKAGKVNINKPRPYVIPLPQNWKNVLNSSKDTEPVDNLTVFVTDEQLKTPQDVGQYHALFVVGETGVYVKSEENQIRYYPLQPMAEEITINSGMIAEVKQAFLEMPVVKNKLYIPMIGIVLFIIFLPLLWLIRFIVALVASVVFYLVALVGKSFLFKNYEFTYPKVLQVAMHTLTAIVFIAYITDFLWRRPFVTGWFYCLLYFIWTMMALLTISQKPSSVAAAPEKSAPRPKSIKKKKTKRKA